MTQQDIKWHIDQMKCANFNEKKKKLYMHIIKNKLSCVICESESVPHNEQGWGVYNYKYDFMLYGTETKKHAISFCTNFNIPYTIEK